MKNKKVKDTGKIILRFYPDHVEIVTKTQGLFKEVVSVEEIYYTEISDSGVSIEATSVELLWPVKESIRRVLKKKKSALKSKLKSKKVKEKPKPKKAAKKQLTINDAAYVGSGQLPGSVSPQEVYKKKKSYYLRKEKNKTLISTGISEVLYNRIFADRKKYLVIPAEFESIKETLIGTGTEKLMEDEFNGWILVAQAKGDIVIETEDDKKMIKLKPKE